jgi:hypothetical protein
MVEILFCSIQDTWPHFSPSLFHYTMPSFLILPFPPHSQAVLWSQQPHSLNCCSGEQTLTVVVSLGFRALEKNFLRQWVFEEEGILWRDWDLRSSWGSWKWKKCTGQTQATEHRAPDSSTLGSGWSPSWSLARRTVNSLRGVTITWLLRW